MQIYKITNTINNPEYYGSGILITRAIEKYGKKNFIKDILNECQSKKGNKKLWQ